MWPNESETRLLDDYYRNSNLFPQPESAIFPKLVLALVDCGIDIEESRRLAGETSMRLPGGDLIRSINLALDILGARAAA
jgi:hypothetical protein